MKGDLMSTTFVIQVKDQNGYRRDDLRDDILEARSKMCDMVNGDDGIINKYWNPMMDAAEFSQEDYEAVTLDSWTAISNAIWTSELHKMGLTNVDIKDERLFLPTPLQSLLGLPGVVKIQVEIRD